MNMKKALAMAGGAIGAVLLAGSPASAAVLFQSVPDLTASAGIQGSGGPDPNQGEQVTFATAVTVHTLSLSVFTGGDPGGFGVSIFADAGGNTLGSLVYQHDFASYVRQYSHYPSNVDTVNIGALDLGAGTYDVFVYAPASVAVPIYDGGVVGRINDINAGLPLAGQTYFGPSYDLGMQISSAPEPSSWVQLILGVVALGAVSRRRRRAAVAGG
jgi:hypothetical protein